MELETREHPTPLGKESSQLTCVTRGTRSLYRERIDLGAFFTQVAERTPGCVAGQSVRVLVDLDPTLGKIETDPTPLWQLMENLLTTAVMFIPSDIRLMARPVQGDGGRWVEISVSHPSPGLPQESHPRMFAPLQQGDLGTPQCTNGLSVGVAICKQLVSVLGGEILVENTASTGTRFRVLLPVRRKTDQSRRSSARCPGDNNAS